MKRIKLRERVLPDYTRAEEIFNMVSHIVGGAFGIIMLVLCIVFSAIRGSLVGVLTSIVYGVSMTMLYCMSSIYHGVTHQMGKKVLQVIDHCTIFFMIAGTYTPILLISVRKVDPVAAWVIFGVVWGFTALGITLNAIDLKAFSAFSMVCYLATGWSVLFIIKQTYEAVGKAGIIWLLIGGIMYSIGSALYAIGRKKHWMHSIFHLFVLLGSFAHGVCIMFYVILKI